MRREILLAALLLASPAAFAQAVPPAPTVQELSGHALVGKVWVPQGGYFLAAEDLLKRAAEADVLLLGETHDNPDHHALQAWMLGQFMAAGKVPLVAFEMMDTGQSAALSSHLAAAPKDAAGLGAAVGWEKAGWPAWSHYQPIAEAALAGGAPLAAASLTRDDTRAIAKGTPSEPLKVSLGLDKPPSDEIRQAMEAEIKASHCDLLPDKALPAMVRVQRARDAHMAKVLAEGLSHHGSAALIAGSGHVRTDRAVPAFLAEMAPGKRTFAVAFVEVQAEKTDPAAYAEIYGTWRLPFDAVWFTPRFARENQCEAMKKHMEKKGG